MNKYTARAKNGFRISLYSDDTFTMAIGTGKRTGEETTAECLADIFPLVELAKLFTKEPSRKLSRAIAIASEA